MTCRPAPAKRVEPDVPSITELGYYRKLVQDSFFVESLAPAAKGAGVKL